MKHIFSKTVLIVCILMMSGCNDYLEIPDASGLTETVVFSTMKDADKVLAAAYAFVPWGFSSYIGAD